MCGMVVENGRASERRDARYPRACHVHVRHKRVRRFTAEEGVGGGEGDRFSTSWEQ